MGAKIYLDYAAATPIDDEVLALMRPYFAELFYNPSADYLAAREIKKQLNTARAKIAYWLGVQANEIIFTAGGTEANNLAINGFMSNYPSAKILTSPVEHDSVLIPTRKYNHQEIPVRPDGRLDLMHLETAIDDSTAMVSVMYANNEIGTIQPLHKIAAIVERARQDRKARGIKLPLVLHTDACQAANYLDLHTSRLGVDLMTLNGGKLYGPKQSGALYVKRGIVLVPQIQGGGQEFNLRSGTENVAQAIGLAASLDKAQSIRPAESARLISLRNHFIERLEKELKAGINGSKSYRLPNNVHSTFAGIDNEYLLIGLDRQGIMAAAGSACSASKEESSHVLHALGLSDEASRSSIRFSLGRQTTLKDIDHTLEVLGRLIKH